MGCLVHELACVETEVGKRGDQFNTKQSHNPPPPRRHVALREEHSREMPALGVEENGMLDLL